MNVFTAESISKSFSERPLFTDISFAMSEGQKVALIAANGTGKSTLLKILAKKEVTDTGKVSYRNELKIGYLEQDPIFVESHAVRDCIFEPNHPVLKAIGEYEELLEMGESVDADKLQKAMDTVDALNAWDYESRASEILGKLGIHHMDQAIGTLSGGQRKRVSLARLLIEDHDLLLLDEPTNHLDLDMIEWLENFIRRQNKTILFISHDRYFLDAVCNSIIELDNGKLYSYNGNYAYYLEKKEEREAIDRATIDKARNTYRKELEWMRRMPKARTTKSKARQDNFYDVEEVAKSARSDKRMQITMQMSRLGSKILELENVCKQFGNKKLIENFSYTFKRGEKIGIIGKNGSGKSTLLNMIMELVKPDQGRIKSGETVVYGYYSQQGINLPEDKRVIDVVKDIAEYVETGNGNWMNVSQFLNHFHFTGAKQHVFVSKLSGGEKKRLFLLTILLKNPNFLILDEPTNDLDIVTLNVLEEFLENYSGCMLMVTHDRYFMDRLVDHVFVLDGNGKVRDIHGNYTEYREEIDQSTPAKNPATTNEDKNNSVSIKTEKNTKKLGFKEKQLLLKIEGDLEQLEKQKEILLHKMNDVQLSHLEITKCAAEFQKVEQRIEELMLTWMELND